MARDHFRHRLQLAAAAALFSTGGAVIKMTALTGWQVACFRSGVAGLAVYLLVPQARRGWSWRVALASVAYASTMVLFVLANKLTTAANTIFLQSTAPLYVALLAPLILREKSGSKDWASIAFIGAGMLLVLAGVPPQATTAPNPVLGNAVALASGVAWALTLITLRWVGAHGRDDSALATVVGGNVIAFFGCLPLALHAGTPSMHDAGLIGFLGLAQIALPYVLMARGLQGVPALEASLLLMLEPVLNPIWAWRVHGEQPGLLPLLGGTVILAAVLLRARHSLEAPDPFPD